MGSAALNCCYVASGYADAVYEFGLHVWDMAAGYLIATEAGAIVTAPTGKRIREIKNLISLKMAARLGEVTVVNYTRYSI